jgi:hypothetical protein
MMEKYNIADLVNLKFAGNNHYNSNVSAAGCSARPMESRKR